MRGGPYLGVSVTTKASLRELPTPPRAALWSFIVSIPRRVGRVEVALTSLAATEQGPTMTSSELHASVQQSPISQSGSRDLQAAVRELRGFEKRKDFFARMHRPGDGGGEAKTAVADLPASQCMQVDPALGQSRGDGLSALRSALSVGAGRGGQR